MKSKFIALSLLAGGMLFADNYKMNQDMQDQQCGCTSCSSCCCVPQPKKCIDCECYTPKFYDLQCAWGVALDVEFLYWYARETNLAYAHKVEAKLTTFPQGNVLGSSTASNMAPEKREYFDTKWDPGFRIGLGWNSDCDGWDVYLNWTWYRNKKRNRTTVDPFGGFVDASGAVSFRVPFNGQVALLNPWTNAGFVRVILAADEVEFGRIPTFFTSVAAKWRLMLNSIDLELGRKYWLSKCFVMRPYAGLRGAWTKTHFDTTSTIANTVAGGVSIDTEFKDRFRNRYWGVGLLAGVQPTWYFTRCFALYSNIDGALIWGKFNPKKREDYLERTLLAGSVVATRISFSDSISDDFFMMQSIIDLAIGLRWEDTWCCDRFRSTLDIGWEHHIWFDHNHRLQTKDSFRVPIDADNNFVLLGYSTIDEVVGNLMFGGLVVRLRFDF